MVYVYFLKSQKDNGLYIGRSNNLYRRLTEHNAGKVASTRARRPLVLLGYDACQTLCEAIIKEKEYKKGFRREELKKRFVNLQYSRRSGRVVECGGLENR